MDLKTGGIAAAVAFSLSFLIGLVSRSTMPLLIVWPLVFALVFFVLFIVARFLLGQFLPELFQEDSESNTNLLPGAVVNIMEGDNGGLADEFSSDASQDSGLSLSWQAPDAARPDDSDKTIGDISALSEVAARKEAANKESSNGVLTGMDQNVETGYTGLGGLDDFSQSTPQMDFEAEAFGSGALSTPTKPAKSAKSSKPAKSGSSTRYSDSEDSLPDLDSMAGVFTNVSTEEQPETIDYSDRGRKNSTGKENTLEGDYTPKDMAEGIRTVLKKDKEE